MFHVKQLILDTLNNIPHKPGVYKFFDSNNKIIYIGKAKDLKKRVSSYFKKHDSAKLNLIVSKIHRIEYIITETENDAFLLENNLIKEYKPKYNVLLKDDKTYPWIKITNEYFPRIIKTRQFSDDGSLYFGPYSSVFLANTLIEILHKLFHFRTCKLNLTAEKIKNNYFKPCLEYHIGNCKAPCIGKQTLSNYNKNIKLAIELINGNLQKVEDFLTKQMKTYSKNLAFELAQETLEKINLLKQYQAKTIIVSPNIKNLNVITFVVKNNTYFFNFLKIKNGALIQSNNFVLNKQLDETDDDLLLYAIQIMNERFSFETYKVLSTLLPSFNQTNYWFYLPSNDDENKLISFSLNNLKTFVHQHTLNKLKSDYGNVNVRLLEKVKTDLNLSELPVRIECFDNSHHSGSFAVASCVVFINGKPSKNDYRHFKIKNNEVPDDFAFMYEVIHRRYTRLLNEKLPLPHLIVIDGGKGQLSAALKALKELNLDTKINIIAIAKRLEEIFKPNDTLPIYLDKRSETLKLIQRIRNEAHRFAINFHRKLKINQSFHSILDDIPYIGDKSKNKILSQFKSIDEILSSDYYTLEQKLGKRIASTLWKHLFS